MPKPTDLPRAGEARKEGQRASVRCQRQALGNDGRGLAGPSISQGLPLASNARTLTFFARFTGKEGQRASVRCQRQALGNDGRGLAGPSIPPRNRSPSWEAL